MFVHFILERRGPWRIGVRLSFISEADHPSINKGLCQPSSILIRTTHSLSARSYTRWRVQNFLDHHSNKMLYIQITVLSTLASKSSVEKSFRSETGSIRNSFDSDLGSHRSPSADIRPTASYTVRDWFSA